MKSIFEEMGGTYRQVGDYFIPNLALPDTGKYQIGKYGRMRRSYLKKYRKIFYNNYVLEGTLFKHLAEIDQACNCLLYTSGGRPQKRYASSHPGGLPGGSPPAHQDGGGNARESCRGHPQCR